MPTHNALLGLLQQRMAPARNALADIAQKPWPYTDPRAFATGMGTAPSEEAAEIGASFIPVAGDAIGLVQDMAGFYMNPETRTPVNGLLSLAATLPFMPRMKVWPMTEYKGARTKYTKSPVDVMVNPQPEQLAQMVRNGEVPRGRYPFRYARDADGNMYVWDAYSAPHEPIARGVEEQGGKFGSGDALSPKFGWFEVDGNRVQELDHAQQRVKKAR